MIGLDKIDEVVNDFVAEFDCEAEFGNEFLYWYDDATIQYSLIIGVTSDIIWTEYVKSTFNYTIENIFIFSLLHEIGHHFTMGLFNKKELKEELLKIDRIEKCLKKSNSSIIDKGYYLQYFDLPMEKAATAWAVKYATNHKAKLDKFWDTMQEALNEFYMANLTE